MRRWVAGTVALATIAACNTRTAPTPGSFGQPDSLAIRRDIEYLASAALAGRFNTAEILQRIRLLEELRDHLGRNIHEGLAIEVAFLAIFIA